MHFDVVCFVVCVSILVFVDVALEQFHTTIVAICDIAVSILVFVDVALEPRSSSCFVAA